MATTIEERLTALERENVEIKIRLSTVEGQFEFISRQLRDSHLYMQAKFAEVDMRFERIEGRMGRVEGRLERVESRLERVETGLAEVRGDIRGLREDLPGMMRDVMREVLAESRKA